MKSIKDRINGLSIPEFKIVAFDSVDSTNTVAKQLAVQGADSGTVVIAAQQVGGKGRKGRSFFSPDGGIYMSVLIRNIQFSDPAYYTVDTAVAVARAIDKLTDCESKIKWVNDVYLNNRKVSGILAESAFDSRELKTNYTVIGIGLNLYEPAGGFAKDIANRAGALFTSDMSDDVLFKNAVELILNELNNALNSDFNNDILPEYINRSFIIGKNVMVSTINGIYEATVMGINNRAELIVRNKEGKIVTLNSGEVSIKL